jgi:nitrogen fixation NifU-like protein
MTADAQDLGRLYRDQVLDHSRHPRNFRRIERAAARAEGHNPLCGDSVTVYLRLDGDRIADAAFEATGCAISMASASLMTEMIRGRTVAAARTAIRDTNAAFAGAEGAAPPDDLAALSGVRAYPSRVRCVLLPWRTLEAALGGEVAAVSTEQDS